MSWPSLSSRLKAASFRLTLLYAGLFTGALVVLLLTGGFLSMLMIERDLKASAAEALERLVAIAAEDGMAALMAEARTLGEGDAEPALFAALQDASGETLAGRLPSTPPFAGWQELPAPDDPEDDLLLATSRELGTDRRLIVAIEADPYYDRLELVLLGTTWVVTAALPLALVCGWLISAMVLRRIALITGTASSIEGSRSKAAATSSTGWQPSSTPCSPASPISRKRKSTPPPASPTTCEHP